MFGLRREVKQLINQLHADMIQLGLNQRRIMAELDNAKAALTQLQTDVAALIAAHAAGIAPADVQALADGMNTLDAQIKAALPATPTP